MTVEPSRTFVDNVVGWLHEGFPRGVPRKDYFPLLALLKRSLSEDEIVQVASHILKDGDFETPVTDEQIREAIRGLIDKDPNLDEMHQVAARLASVGWPLSGPER